MSNNKWQNIKNSENASKDDPNSPVDTEAEIMARIRNTNGPVDTPGELKHQKHNLGPKDLGVELKEQSDELDVDSRLGPR